MYAGVTHVKPLNNHRLELTFDTGEVRYFDATALLSFGRFSELADETNFRQVSVSFDTIQWPNGLDLDPEYLYAASVKQSHSEAAKPA
jgi:hypothetical protein